MKGDVESTTNVNQNINVNSNRFSLTNCILVNKFVHIPFGICERISIGFIPRNGMAQCVPISHFDR